MKKYIFSAIAIAMGLFMTSCKRDVIPVRNAELTVTYQGKQIAYKRPTWFNESQLRAELKKPGKKFLIFGAPWCKACSVLRSALAQGNLLDRVIFVNIDETWAAQVAGFYGINAIPTMFELAQDTRVVSRKIGPNKIVMHIMINSDG